MLLSRTQNNKQIHATFNRPSTSLIVNCTRFISLSPILSLHNRSIRPPPPNIIPRRRILLRHTARRLQLTEAAKVAEALRLLARAIARADEMQYLGDGRMQLSTIHPEEGTATPQLRAAAVLTARPTLLAAACSCLL